jgi:glycosyltransferase involved in cell wall biosynthesis
VPTIELAFPVKAPALLWLHLRLPAALRSFDGIFHDPFNFMPFFTPIPSVVTVHDLSFETHPHLFGRTKAYAFRANARWAVRRATCITTVSEWSRQEIIERYGVSPDRVHLVPNGVEPTFRPLDEGDLPEAEERLKSLGIGAPYVVAFGGLRRGVAIAVAAWRLLRRKGYPHGLVLIDGEGPVGEGITWVQAPAQADLKLMLAGATLLLYPTETESFGMPALEAAASGTVPLGPAVGALPEVLGDAAVWCDRTPESLAEAADRLLSDARTLAVHRDRGLEMAKRWTWDLAAERLLDVYARAAEG